jgi:hypothetical protein
MQTLQKIEATRQNLLAISGYELQKTELQQKSVIMKFRGVLVKK